MVPYSLRSTQFPGRWGRWCFIFLLPDSFVYKIPIVHAPREFSGCLRTVVLPGHKMAAFGQSNLIFGCRTTEATHMYKYFLSSPNTSGVISRETRDFFFGCPSFVFGWTHPHSLPYTQPLIPRSVLLRRRLAASLLVPQPHTIAR